MHPRTFCQVTRKQTIMYLNLEYQMSVLAMSAEKIIKKTKCIPSIAWSSLLSPYNTQLMSVFFVIMIIIMAYNIKAEKSRH